MKKFMRKLAMLIAPSIKAELEDNKWHIVSLRATIENLRSNK